MRAVSLLVGREGELALALDGLSQGFVLVSGARGMGRSALASAVATEAERRGHATVWVVTTESLRAVPFGALGFLLTDADPEELTAEPARAIGRICAALRNRATPTIVVIDDAHLLDVHSADAVAQAVSSRVAVLIATAPDGVPLPASLDRLAAAGRVAPVALRALDRTAVVAAAGELLGSPVADATAELLWRWSGGVPRLLQAVVEAGRAADRFQLRSGLWWWAGEEVIPPAIDAAVTEQIAGDERLDDALDLVALAEEADVDEIGRIVGSSALVTLERRGLVTTRQRGATMLVRCSTPLVGAQRLQAMTPLRLRSAARTLLAAVAPRPGAFDVARRATWHLHGDVRADSGLLRDACSVVRPTNPDLARRLAEANCRWNGGVAALADLVDNHIEGNDPTRARAALESMSALAASDEDLALVDATAFAVALFGERRPADAHHVIAAARQRGNHDAGELRSMDALVNLMEADTAHAGRQARAVLAERDPSVRARLRAGIVDVAATVLAGDTAEALDRARTARTLADDNTMVMPSVAGMVQAVAAFASLWRGDLRPGPPASPAAARWPAPPLVPAAPVGSEQFEWPLLAGIIANLRGDHGLAVRTLRDAVVQQGSGKGVFHVEALAWLVVAQCDAGLPAAAAVSLQQFPDHHLGVLPGLREWAEAVLAFAGGDDQRAAALLTAAADVARDADAFLIEALYRVELADRGDDEGSIARLDELSMSLDAPLMQCLCRAAVARLKQDAAALVEHATTLARYGVNGRAIRAASEATRIARSVHDRRSAKRASALARSLRAAATTGGGIVPEQAAPRPPGVLSRREAEVAGLAARGLTDRVIAARLVVSIRTIESHLASSYRKLGISSRAQLERALAAAAA